MEYLFSKWEELKRGLSGKYIILFLDYDGTLTPIVKAPKLALLSDDTRLLLKRLSQNRKVKLAIISGRSLQDIKNTIGIKDIIYAGNHGLEVEGPKIKFESQVSPRLKSVIRSILKEITEKLSGIKGIIIEDKVLTISIHYRMVENNDVVLIDKIISCITNRI